MKLRLILVILLVTVGTLVQAQYASHKTMPDPSRKVKTDMKDWSFKLSTTISTYDLKEHIYTLASDAYEGRETGTRGNAKAAEYISNEFKRLGLPTIGEGDTYYQSVDFTFSSWDKATFSLGGQELKLLQDFISFPQFSKASEISSEEVVFAGYGIDDEMYSDYAGVDVSGKVVMIWDGEPASEDGMSLIKNGEEPSTWSTDWKRKSQIAQDKGAELLIIISNDLKSLINQNRRALVNRVTQLGNHASADYGANTIFLSPTKAQEILGDKADAIIASRDALRMGKKTSTYHDLGINASASIQPARSVLSGYNVMGFIEGSEKPEEVVVVSAHYDHVGTKGDEVFNGADDNASGTTTVLEIAEALVTAKRLGNGPKRSVLCLLVTGEEKGLLGSEYYAANPIFALENTVADVNIDMVGRWGKEYLDKGDPYIYVIGSDRLSQDLHDVNEEMNSTYSNMLLDYKYNSEEDPNRFYFRSDHYNFAKHGIPSIFYFNGVHADYHRLTDTVEKIDLKLMEKRARHIFHTIWSLSNRKDRIRVTVAN